MVTKNSHHDGGFLVQWIGIDDERAIEPALRGEHVANLLNGPGAEALDFAIGPTGLMRLFDSGLGPPELEAARRRAKSASQATLNGLPTNAPVVGRQQRDFEGW